MENIVSSDVTPKQQTTKHQRTKNTSRRWNQPVRAGRNRRAQLIRAERRWLVVILCGALFYVTVTFSFLLVYDTSKKKVVFSPLVRAGRRWILFFYDSNCAVAALIFCAPNGIKLNRAWAASPTVWWTRLHPGVFHIIPWGSRGLKPPATMVCENNRKNSSVRD